MEKSAKCTTRVEKLRMEIEKIELELHHIRRRHKDNTEKKRDMSERLNRLGVSREPKVSTGK